MDAFQAKYHRMNFSLNISHTQPARDLFNHNYAY